MVAFRIFEYLNKVNRLSSKQLLNNFFRPFFRKASTIFGVRVGFTPCKAEQPLPGIELQEKKHKKDYRIQKICLERTYS